MRVDLSPKLRVISKQLFYFLLMRRAFIVNTVNNEYSLLPFRDTEKDAEMVRKQKTPEHPHCFDVYQFYRLPLPSLAMGTAAISVQWDSDYGERCRENYDADANE